MGTAGGWYPIVPAERLIETSETRTNGQGKVIP